MLEWLYKRKKGLRLRMPQLLFVFYVLVPIFTIYLVLRIIPIFSTIYLSFHRWNIVDPVKPFIGLANYRKLFGDTLFHTAIWNTTLFALVTVPSAMGISLALALVLNRKEMKFAHFYQFIYFIPVVTPMIPVAVVWKWIYDPTYGILNYLISLFGFRPVNWLLEPRIAIWSIMAMSVWKVIGFDMVLFLVGLKNIPDEFYEAATIDGGSGWQIFRYITLPLLKPIILFITVISTINAYNVFSQVYVMTTGTQGAPGHAVRVLVYDMYENGFRYFKMGYAAAEAVILLLIVVILTIIEFGAIRREA